MLACPKCGGKTIIGPRWCPGDAPWCPTAPPAGKQTIYHREHLLHMCTTCGYWTVQPCLDAVLPS